MKKWFLYIGLALFIGAFIGCKDDSPTNTDLSRKVKVLRKRCTRRDGPGEAEIWCCDSVSLSPSLLDKDSFEIDMTVANGDSLLELKIQTWCASGSIDVDTVLAKSVGEYHNRVPVPCDSGCEYRVSAYIWMEDRTEPIPIDFKVCYIYWE